MSGKTEIVPNNRAIWQSDHAMTYRCPVCQRHVFSQHEGDELPEIHCEGKHHRLVWIDAPATELRHQPSHTGAV